MHDLNPARTHIPSLDGVRALAILSVVVVHSYYRGPHSGLSGLGAHFVILGWSGVDLFFVLSGFLISSILLEAKGRNNYFQDFYVKRVGRIFPLYYSILLFFIATSVINIPKVTPMLANYVGHWWAYFSFVSNLDGVFGWKLNNPLGPAWSLAVEEQYYLVWPALVFFFNRTTLKILVPALLVGCAILRIVLIQYLDPEAIYHFTLTHADAILTGSAIALYRDEISRNIRYFYFTLPLLATVLLAIFVISGSTHNENRIVQKYGYLMMAIFYGNFVILSIVNDTLSRALSIKPLRIIGKYSYCIYLIHWPMLLVADQLSLPGGLLPWLAFLVVFIGLTTGLAAISWAVLEKPMATLIRRIGLARQEV